MDHEVQEQLQEREIRKLRAEFADVPLIRAVLTLDLAIRRTAWRALALTRADTASRSLQH